jgi:hypothetical protein
MRMNEEIKLSDETIKEVIHFLLITAVPRIIDEYTKRTK